MKPALIDLPAAVRLLAEGKVVAMPTETVYGLAARIDLPEGLRRIFSTKERPFFDPLIVHVSSLGQARGLTSRWSPAAAALAEAFWPGPLTLVLPKAGSVNPLITSGLESVGIRMPKHPLALQLITRADGPLAAPSANRFGRTSPTAAAHVLSEFQNRVPVLDGGPCEIGIESTVLRLTIEEGVAVLNFLRPGALTPRRITACLEKNRIPYRIEEALERSIAPGRMKHHYMPEIPLIWVEDPSLTGSAIMKEANARLDGLPAEIDGVKLNKPARKLAKGAELSLDDDPALAARELYALLREKSSSGADHLIYRHDPKREGPEWAGILDRLKKASHLVL